MEREHALLPLTTLSVDWLMDLTFPFFSGLVSLIHRLEERKKDNDGWVRGERRNWGKWEWGKKRLKRKVGGRQPRRDDRERENERTENNHRKRWFFPFWPFLTISTIITHYFVSTCLVHHFSLQSWMFTTSMFEMKCFPVQTIFTLLSCRLSPHHKTSLTSQEDKGKLCKLLPFTLAY